MPLSTFESVSDSYAPCKDCKSSNVILDQRQGCSVCTDCGLVQVTQVYEERMAFEKDGSKYSGRATYRAEAPLFDEFGRECSHAGCLDTCTVQDIRLQVWKYIRQLGSRMGLVRRVVNLAGQFWKEFHGRYPQHITHGYHYAMACIRLATLHDGVSLRTLQEIRHFADPDLRPLKAHTRVAKLVQRIKPYTTARVVSWKEQACRLVSCILARMGMLVFESTCHRLVRQYFTKFVGQPADTRTAKTPRVVAAGVVFALSWYYGSPLSVEPQLPTCAHRRQMDRLKAVNANQFFHFASKTAVSLAAKHIFEEFLEPQLSTPAEEESLEEWVQQSTRSKFVKNLESAQLAKRQKVAPHVARAHSAP